MTPQPTSAEMKKRRVLNPHPGKTHIHDLINHAKDGIFNKDILSTHLTGMILFAVRAKIIRAWEGSLFQIPFVLGPKLRTTAPQYGHPFIGPDGKIAVLDDMIMRGGPLSDEDHVYGGYFTKSGNLVSDLDIEGMMQHERYEEWLSYTLYAWGNENSGVYTRSGELDSLREIDKFVNGQDYVPGPGTLQRSNLMEGNRLQKYVKDVAARNDAEPSEHVDSEQEERNSQALLSILETFSRHRP